MKPKVYITRKIEGKALEKLQAHCEVTMWHEKEIPVPRIILMEQVKDVDGLFCLITEKVDEEVLKVAENLKVISNLAVGYNNIDIDLAKEKGIVVTNTPEVLTETTADLTFALLMATARRIVEANNYLKESEWKSWSPMQLTGQDIHGATLGIIGLGRIGAAVARRACGFNMQVIYHNRSRKQQLEEELGAFYVGLDELLKQSDYVCVMAPYTSETHHLIDERELNLMKETSILINSARGAIVNEQALYNALVEKKIWGAGLDVFEQEPVTGSHPLVSLPNVVALPHIGSASIPTRLEMTDVAAENLIKVLNKEHPIYRVV